MKKVNVKVCVGTTCYTQGQDNLKKLSKLIPEKYGNKVELLPSQCLGVCSIQWGDPKPPYAKVNEDIIQEATVEKIIEAIDEKLKVSC
ncbi:NAD(P)H-dependent oxidoreductase subunit E [bacterium]|nr:NAD(P)H-dependent oxidoreductase subunit E [bacterium]